MRPNSNLLFLPAFLLLLLVNSGSSQTCTFTYSLGNDTSFCPGTAINLNLVAPSGLAPYLWDNGSTSAIRSVNSFGTYYCKASQIGADLVTNGNFDSGNTGFTSDYIVGTGGTWGPISNPGTYLITTDATLAHSNFQSFADHSNSGNMMVVNGSGTPNQSVWCQSIVVSPNTDYNFSTWVANCVTPVPLLQFSINGSPLGGLFSPPAAVGLWTQFSAVWNSGSNANAVICIVNQNISPPGNDFALDDIFFQPICTFTDTIKVTPKAIPSLVDAGKDTAICAGESIVLAANQGTGTSVTWSSNPIGFSSSVLNPVVTPSLTTSYILNSTLDGCSKKDTVAVVVNTLPKPDFTTTTTDSSCNSFVISMNNISTNSSSYFWEFGDGTNSIDSIPTHSYTESGTYEIKLTAKENGCFSSKSLPVTVVFSASSFTLPNVITPNGDEHNENFYIPNSCLESASVAIYNRWGVLIKKWEGLDGSWDGKIKGAAAAEGVYYYIMEGAFANGEITRQHGTISLYR
jgi:gliding motility-associated-like protein